MRGGRRRGGVSHEEDTASSHRLHLHPGEAQLVTSVLAQAEQRRSRGSRASQPEVLDFCLAVNYLHIYIPSHPSAV